MGEPYRLWGVICLLAFTSTAFAQIDRLLQGGQMSFRVDNAEYIVQRNCLGQVASGSYSQSSVRVVFDPSTLNFSIPLNRLFSGFSTDAVVNYSFEDSTGDYVWINEPLTQPICTTFTVNGTEYRFRIDRVFSMIFFSLSEVPYQPDPLDTLQCVSARVDFASGPFCFVDFIGHFVDENCNPLEQGCFTLLWYDTVGFGGGRPGDVECDDCVNDVDLLRVLFAFGSSDPETDLDGNGLVDDADLLIVLQNYGSGC